MQAQRSGRMIVTTSVAAYQCEPAIGAAYMAAKAGAAHLMRCVAQELAADGITVNAIAPGFFVTNIGGGHAKQPQVQAAMSSTIPTHRVGFPEDIKGLALFLASPASAYVTGQINHHRWRLDIGRRRLSRRQDTPRCDSRRRANTPGAVSATQMPTHRPPGSGTTSSRGAPGGRPDPRQHPQQRVRERHRLPHPSPCTGPARSPCVTVRHSRRGWSP